MTDAADRDLRSDAALRAALIADGPAALGVPDDVGGGFSAEFVAGMTGDADRSQRLAQCAHPGEKEVRSAADDHEVAVDRRPGGAPVRDVYLATHR